eukprot:TRINITY_DN16474_c0_g1_i1.p1 TRINITY_DN16474_c0_g1~~TRINITY_DN16474_c0_g1_i1.p1  ORF type:complete len:474 (+),score=105.35 TRINITY_DN16474_c0_g1_i1:77-1498(+)
MVGSTRRINPHGYDRDRRIRWTVICLSLLSVGAVIWYIMPSGDAGPRKSRAGAEFGDIWDTRMGDTEENVEVNQEQMVEAQEIAGDREAALKKILGRRTIHKIDEWDFGDLPEKNWQPLDLSTEVSSYSIPFVIAEYRSQDPEATPEAAGTADTVTTNAATTDATTDVTTDATLTDATTDITLTDTTDATTTRVNSLLPLRFALPWWHPDALQAITMGSSLPYSKELLYYSELLSKLLEEFYPKDINATKNLPKRQPLIVDIGSCLGHLPLVAAMKGLKSIVYQPVVVNAEKIRLSVAFNGYEDLVTVFEAAALDEIGDLEMAFPLEARRACEASISLSNLQLEETGEESSIVWIDVQMVRADYSVEWLNLMDDILLLHVSSMGFEYQAIKGSYNLFKTGRVHNVIHEFWPFGISHSGIEPIAFLLYMDELGFKLNHMPPPEDGFSTAYQTDREFKRLAELGNERTTLHWIRK